MGHRCIRSCLQFTIILSLLEYLKMISSSMLGPFSAACRKIHLPATKRDRKCEVRVWIAALSFSRCIFHVFKLLCLDLVHVVLKVILLAA